MEALFETFGALWALGIIWVIIVWPILIVYALLRGLHDLRRIAVAQEALTQWASFFAKSPASPPRPDSQPVAGGVPMSQFGR